MNKKRLFSAIVAFTLIMALFPVHTMAAGTLPEESVPADNTAVEESIADTKDLSAFTGRIPFRYESIGEAGTEEALEAVGSYAYTPYEAVANWDDYASNYFYNRIGGWQRKVYDRIEEAVKYYLNSETANAEKIGNSYYIEIDISDIGVNVNTQSQELRQVHAMFFHSNPQYFFLNVGCRYNYYGNGIIQNFYLQVYDEMADGTARRNAVDQVNAQINSVIAGVKGLSTQLEQEKAVHDWICERVVYDHEFVNMTSAAEIQAYETTHYTQSAYSVLRNSPPPGKQQHETVCAGYAQTFALLCNALDIDTVSITSPNHQWNRVRLNGNWYTVDCTWDDAAGGYHYRYFNRSTKWVLENDSLNSHAADAYQEKYMPSSICEKDRIPVQGDENDGVFCGSVAEADGKAVSPSGLAFSVDSSPDKVYVELTAESGSEIYYTTDGSEPTVNDRKSSLYDGAFAVDAGTNIQAISYRKGALDSDIFRINAAASGSVLKYMVSFDGNGGEAEKPSIIVEKGKKYGILPGAVKAGYTFAGWYTKASGGTQVTSDSVFAGNGSQTLYAHWTANQYKVTLDVNGGDELSPEQKTVQVTYGQPYGNLVIPTRAGYTFDGWYLTPKFDERNKVTADRVVQMVSAHILYAKWIVGSDNNPEEGKVPGTNENPEEGKAPGTNVKPEADKDSSANKTPKQYTVTFHVNGGKALASSKRTKQVTYGKTYGTLVTPKRNGYTFTGWYTKRSGGSKITKNTKVTITKATTLYAHWKKVTVGTVKQPTAKCTGTKKLKVTWKAVSGAKGYQIRYSTSKNFTKKTTRVLSQAKRTATMKKLKSGKKYYVQVKAYKLDSMGRKVYGKWSKTAVRKVK